MYNPFVLPDISKLKEAIHRVQQSRVEWDEMVFAAADEHTASVSGRTGSGYTVRARLITDYARFNMLFDLDGGSSLRVIFEILESTSQTQVFLFQASVAATLAHTDSSGDVGRWVELPGTYKPDQDIFQQGKELVRQFCRDASTEYTQKLLSDKQAAESRFWA
jgi:hypothetical protein